MLDEPHATACTKNEQQVLDGTHQASHGYTKTLTDYELIDVKPRGIKPDTAMDWKNDPVWPPGLTSETYLAEIPSGTGSAVKAGTGTNTDTGSGRGKGSAAGACTGTGIGTGIGTGHGRGKGAR